MSTKKQKPHTTAKTGGDGYRHVKGAHLSGHNVDKLHNMAMKKAGGGHLSTLGRKAVKKRSKGY
jgi:hypothetical protein